MPLPNPSSGEDHDEFIERCMSNATMRQEFPDRDQRFAVCEQRWDDDKGQEPVTEFKSVPFEFKVDTAKREFEGYASTFGNVDRVRDTVTPGAFKETIEEQFKGGRIKVLYQHREPLGVPIHMEEDSTGLFTRSRISKTALGDDVLHLLADGVIDRLSIGFEVIESEERDDGIRELRQIKLWEYSPVTFAADDHAAITAVKEAALDAIREAKSRRDLERILRNAGISRNGAAAFIAKARDLNESDSQFKSLGEALNDLRAFARQRINE